ncbi:hypothetical protein GCM10010106_21630 [Thermopolyspora flexuosa]|uniref:hypothetical protein n=1 Tax=Thermopolyspora flexuosa TaxID=103836 RepID=UPI00114EFF9C|nr:hypothetical protein [Thermopolyspora flexuosa]GGM74824.1 hypothetical protein GCM10010106_21630 [Thermopolyspora flexuosa]
MAGPRRQAKRDRCKGVAFFDVTTLKKHLLVEVVAILLSRGCTRVHSFDLIKAPTHDERDLIHNLKPSVFAYRTLSQSRHIANAQKRMLARSLTLKTLLLITGLVAALVLLVEILFDETWLDQAILTIGTITTIGGFFSLLLRENH